MRDAPQTLTNTNSTSIAEVTSTAGFSAGDLVYLQNNDYKTLSSGSATSTFAATTNVPNSLGLPSLSYVQQVFDNTTSPGYTKLGASCSQSAAVLANGNIVHVFKNPSTNSAMFCIKDSSGAVVVAATNISGNTPDSGTINVCALTGGNFAVTFVTGTSIQRWVYGPTGTAVASIATVGTCVSNDPTHVLAARPDGSFVVAWRNGSSYITVRTYGSTGTALSTAQNDTTSMDGNFPLTVAVRSDNTFVIAGKLSGGTTYRYTIWSSAGTLSSASNFTTASPNVSYGISSFAAADNSIVFVYTYNRSDTSKTITASATLSSSNVLGSEVTLVQADNCLSSVSTSSITTTNVLKLADGNFIVAFQDATGTSAYAFFNSSGTCLSGTNTNGVIPRYLYGVLTLTNNHMHMVEYGDYVNLFFSPATTGSSSQQSLFQSVVKINKTTYEIYLPSSVSSNLGTTSLASAGYAPSGSTPTSASFYAAATTATSISASMAISVGPVTSYLATTSALTRAAACCVTNGDFVLLEQGSVSPYPIYASVYSGTTGTKSTTITVTAGGGSGTNSQNIKITPTPSGGFVVAYYSSTNIMTIATYNSSYALTSSFSPASTSIYNTQYCFDVCVLTSGYYALIFRNNSNSGYPSVKVFSSTGTLIWNFGSQLNTFNQNDIRAVAGPNDTIYCVAPTSGTGSSLYTFYRTAASTWSQGTTSASMGVTTYTNTNLNVLPCGAFVFINGNSATSQSIDVYYLSSLTNITNQSSTSVSGTAFSLSPVPNSSLTATSNGSYYYYSVTGSTATTRSIGLTGKLAVSSYTYPSSNDSVPTGMTPSTDIATVYAVVPSVGNKFLIFYADGANNLEAMTVVGLPTASAYTFTSGVSTSVAVPVGSGPSSTTGAIQNAQLAGVALSGAGAGGTGKLIVRGPATLNSNYSASNTGAFDFQTNSGVGVKGFYSGRNVTLLGSE